MLTIMNSLTLHTFVGIWLSCLSVILFFTSCFHSSTTIMTTIACDNCCSANNPSNLVGSILLHNSEGEHDGATISISDGLSSLFSYWVGATAPDKLGRLQFCPGCAHIFRKLHKISLQFQNLTKMESQVAKSLAQLRRQGQKITKIIPPPPPPRTFNGQQQQVRRSLRNQNSKETVQPVAKEKRTQKIDKRHVRGQKEGDISFKIKEEEEDICFVQLCEDGPSDSLVFEEVMGETNDIEMDNDAQLESPSNQSEHDDDDSIFDEPDDVQNMSDDESSNYSPDSGDDSDAEPTNPLTCSICSQKFATVETKSRHVRLQHDDTFTRIPCPADDCDLAFKRFDHLRNHLKRKHPDVSFPKLRKTGDNASPSKIPCPVPTCDKTYSRNDHLNIHIRAAHPDVPVESRKKAAKKSKRNEKEKDNSPPCPDDDGIFDPLKCSVCFKKFSSVETTDRHFRHQHDETFIPLLCPSDNCDLTFKRRDHLKRHLDKTHPDFVPPKAEPFPPADSDSAPNPLKCSICFKKFGTVDTKERHFRHMHDETFTRLPCPADNCDLSFKRRDHLHRHLRRKHPTVPFFTMGSRSRPVRKDDLEHIGDRIPCPVATCEKTYSRTDHLNIHIRKTHPDTPLIKGSKKGKKYGSKVPEIKPCPVCEKEIKSSRMKEHMETHASEKTHLCNTCGKLFRTMKSLRHHLKTCVK